MAGRGPQTFQKKQKEQRRKEKREEKMARRLERKQAKTVLQPGETEPETVAEIDAVQADTDQS